ncbi:MAG TPA: MBL fold metallo-hydrolase [Actinoplanes sp.]|nr:MBL fold metallo-hydrolase [Actinoplanes sp.]
MTGWPACSSPHIGPIDAVVISHDHWDHLDQPTISAMTGWTGTTFVVPLWAGAHLERWGIPAARIRELDWWQSTPVGTLQLTSTPALHTSGRDPLHNDETLWSGWALAGPQHRVWYSGDSGYFPDLAEIGTRLGPFDVTLIESGQYDPAWPANHLGPDSRSLAGQGNGLPGYWACRPAAIGSFGWSARCPTRPSVTSQCSESTISQSSVDTTTAPC